MAVGLVLTVYAPQVLWNIGTWQQWDAELTAHLWNLVVTTAHVALVPLGAVLIGAAVVIESVSRSVQPQSPEDSTSDS